jgi:hypothetical protein
MSNPISAEDVETRLRALPRTATLTDPDARAVQELGSFEPSTRPPVSTRPRLVIASSAVAATLLAVLLVNIVAAYFAPRYAQALADTPGVGPISGRMLHTVGLGGGDMTVFGDSATSSGHTLKLEGGFVDGLRMVLFVSIDGKGLDGNPKGYGMNVGDWGLSYDDFTLTDQFGHTYAPNLVGGSNVVQFMPLVWPASEVGARLTFHVTGIVPQWEKPPWKTLAGDWTLRATLVSGQANTLPVPAPVHTDNATYTFTGIAAAGRTLIVHVKITGPITYVPPATSPNQGLDVFQPAVYDAAGDEMQLEEFGVEWPRQLGNAMSGEMTAYITGPGHYRIVIAGQDRWITVP